MFQHQSLPGGEESAHLVLRSGNPALGANTFTSTPRAIGDAAMTIGGTVNKTAMALAILFIAATYVWGQATAGTTPTLFIWGGLIGGFILALVTVVKQTWAPFTTPLYAVFEGASLGAISFIFEQRYPGIVSQAIFLTFGTLGALLIAYRTGLIKATENFKLGVAAATGGVCLVYLLSFVAGWFGIAVPLIHSSGALGILFSLFVVTIAALNLVLDFDFIEEGAERGAPKHMEWYGAFGLLVTLIWLYLEFLHLLAKLQDRR